MDWEHSQEEIKKKKGAHRDIGDREFEEVRVCDIEDWKTPKPDCNFLL
jgi:hypothetical protein